MNWDEPTRVFLLGEGRECEDEDFQRTLVGSTHLFTVDRWHALALGIVIYCQCRLLENHPKVVAQKRRPFAVSSRKGPILRSEIRVTCTRGALVGKVHSATRRSATSWIPFVCIRCVSTVAPYLSRAGSTTRLQSPQICVPALGAVLPRANWAFPQRSSRRAAVAASSSQRPLVCARESRRLPSKQSRAAACTPC